MATIQLSTIRKRVATAMEAISGAGLKESPLPFDAFGRTPNSIAHKAFSVGIGGSNAQDDRQRPLEGAMLQTDLDITFAYRLRPLDQLTDVDNQLDMENTIITALLDRTDSSLYPNLHIKFISSNRLLTDSGEYVLSTLSFEALHFIPLQ
jgi:hypothetical protein